MIGAHLTKGVLDVEPHHGPRPVAHFRLVALLLIGAVLAFAAACAPAAESEDAPAPRRCRQARASRFGDYGPETPPFDGRNRNSLYIPMKDGIQLAIDYYLPTAGGIETKDKLPVVLHYTRYQRATEDETGKLQTQMDADPVLQHLSQNGYAIAVADARGTGASFGVNNGAFSKEENADSAAIIEWLAAQPWSNGNVGMQGRSYPGMTQYEAATQGPPSLKAIFAEMAGPTAYDFVFTNGTYKKDFVEQWGGLTKAMDLRSRPGRRGSTPTRTASSAIRPWRVTPRTCGRTTSCRRRRTATATSTEPRRTERSGRGRRSTPSTTPASSRLTTSRSITWSAGTTSTPRSSHSSTSRSRARCRRR